MAALLLAGSAAYADVSLVGVLKDKALLSVNGAAPKTYPVGATLPDGSKLVAVHGNEATLEEGGKRYAVRLGEFAAAAPTAGSSMVLSPDAMGHFNVMGEINGIPARMMVDTGASLVSIPAHEARRMGIDYRLKGRRAFSNTAGGTTEVWIVKLDRLRVNDIEINGLEASVTEAGLPFILLGNSFLKRFDMKTEGGYLTLTRRY
jgi:aspartyl protease family protein